MAASGGGSVAPFCAQSPGFAIRGAPEIAPDCGESQQANTGLTPVAASQHAAAVFNYAMR
jgi:hypothetical protein